MEDNTSYSIKDQVGTILSTLSEKRQVVEKLDYNLYGFAVVYALIDQLAENPADYQTIVKNWQGSKDYETLQVFERPQWKDIQSQLSTIYKLATKPTITSSDHLIFLSSADSAAQEMDRAFSIDTHEQKLYNLDQRLSVANDLLARTVNKRLEDKGHDIVFATLHTLKPQISE